MRIFGSRFLTACHIVFVALLSAEPDMKTREIQITITQGLDAILPCLIDFSSVSSTQRDKYSVLWSDGTGRYISVDERVMTDHRKYRIIHDVPNEWNLQINGVRSTDAGKYKCQVNSNPVQTNFLVLHVNVPPRIVSSESVVVKEGEQLVIYCNVTGIPTPNVTWSKQGTDLSTYRGEMFVKEVAVRSDSGVYRCEADNGVERPESENVLVDVLYPPTVQVLTNRINQYKERMTILECRVTANPAETVTWYKNGEPLRDNWKYKSNSTKYESEEFSQSDGSRTHSLFISYLDRSDFGDYVCMAVNKVGTASAILTVSELKTTTQAPPTTARPTTIRPTPDPTTTQTSDPVSTSSTVTLTSSKYAVIPGKTDASTNGGEKENLVEVPDSSAKRMELILPALLLPLTAVIVLS